MSEPIYATPGDVGRLRYGGDIATGAVAVGVAASCGGAFGRWVCIEHAMIFNHYASKDAHLGDQHATPCRIAWLCAEGDGKHGVEEA